MKDLGEKVECWASKLHEVAEAPEGQVARFDDRRGRDFGYVGVGWVAPVGTRQPDRFLCVVSKIGTGRIETRDDGRIILESRDRKVSFETTLSAIEDLLLEERLELATAMEV